MWKDVWFLEPNEVEVLRKTLGEHTVIEVLKRGISLYVPLNVPLLGCLHDYQVAESV